MRIIEKTDCVLTIREPARDFWFGTIYLFFAGPFFMALIVRSSQCWGFLLLLVVAVFFCLSLKQIWMSEIVKDCSFNKTSDRVVIRFHGLKTKVRDFPLREIKTIKVAERVGFYYKIIETYQLLLVRKYAEPIPLSEEYYKPKEKELKAIATQIQDFLCLDK